MSVNRALQTLEVKAVDHVGLAVPDLDAAIAFHTEVLGGRLTHRETNPGQQVEEAMIAFGADTPAPAAAPTALSTQLQLLAPTGPDSTIAKFIDRQGPGLQQLAIRVADVSAAAATLRSRGLRVLYDQPQRGTAGSLINFVHPKDAGGVLLELVQPSADEDNGQAGQGGTVSQPEGVR